MKQIIPILSIVVFAGATEIVTSTAENQSELFLTVYNSNRALVSEQRNVDLERGVSTVRFSDIASNIMPQTVIVENDGSMDVLEQNYEYDLISNQKLMEKYVGREVSIVRENQYTGESETVSATLLSANGTPTFEIDGQIYLGYEGQIILPELPENLYARPTMNWLVNASQSGEQNLEVSYLTNGIKWEADYVLNLADDEESASLTGWVTLTNNAGVDFNNANLKLVAGDVNMVQPVQYNSSRAMQMEMSSYAMDAGGSQMSQEEFFEYHLYSYPRQVTVRDRQVKQISLLSVDEVETHKEYSVQMNNSYYNVHNGSSEHPVNVDIVFETGEDNNIDMPIPAGTIRLYKKASDGSSVFIGEDRVNHTPVDEEVSLRTGEAFDIVVESKQTSFEQTNNNRVTTSGYEVEIRNHKDESITVEIEVPVYGEWEITNSSHEFDTENIQLITFDVEVPADGESILTYTVQVRR